MKEVLSTALLEWYARHGRHDLPWRTTNDPYAIYVSEIMLQQTQVKTVLERYYFPFLEAFPTLAELSKADLDDVLKRWEGLGYYTRARNLHTAARLCKGDLPKNAAELMKLPGIGRSTAHAIAAFAYGERLPILDANVKRILYRFFALEQRDEKRLWEYAYTLFDASHPFEYNQAMMDIGSSVCTPKNPRCDACPFQAYCQGKDSPLDFPRPSTAKSKPVRRLHLVIHTNGSKLALSQRTSRFLNGLWGFYETEEKTEEMRSLGDLTQHYSHFTLEALVWQKEGYELPEGFEWFELDEVQTLSLSRADHKALALLRYNWENQNGCECV